MKYAFDLDGTITKYPIILGNIMSSLKNSGHEVVIVTVGSNDPRDSKEFRLQWAASLGLVGYELFYLNVGETKGELLKHLNVDCLIDDSPNILIEAKEKNPNLCPLRINQ